MAHEAWVELPVPQDTGRGDDHPYDFGFVPRMGRLLMAHPRIGQAFQDMYGAIMFAPSHLSRQEREMIAGVATAAQFCHY